MFFRKEQTPSRRGWLNRAVGMPLLMAAFAALLLCTCDSAPESRATAPAGDNANELRFDVNAPFGPLNPTGAGASGANYIFPFLYSYLFVPDENGNLVPDLATHWQFDPERLTWTIEIREDARFHDGKPVRAKDVKHSLDCLIKNKDPQLSALIAGIACPSITRVAITLKKTDPHFLHTIWQTNILPSRHNVEAADFSNHPIGSGPFVFRSRQGSDQAILEANADYYGGRPSLDRIVFSYQPDRELTWLRLLRGETDIASEIVPLNYRMMKRIEALFYFDQHIIDYCTTLLYNTHDPLFSDPRVRMALTHAIDRQFIVDEILEGYGVVAAGPMGVDSPYRDPGLKPIAYDPYKAVSLLQSAGWSRTEDGRLANADGTFFDFTLLVFRESQIEKRVATYIQLCLDEIGIRMRIKAVSYDELTRAYYRNTAFQAVLTELSNAEVSIGSLIAIWAPSISGCSIAGCFQDPEIMRLSTEALQVMQPERQRALLQAFDARIAALQAGSFLFQKTAIDVISKRFKLADPFSLDCRGLCSLKNASLTIR